MNATTVREPESAVDQAPAQHRTPLSGGWSLWHLAAARSAGMPMSWWDRFAEWDPEAGSEADARAGSAAAVRAIVTQPSFLEAVTWQNASVVRNWLGRYAKELAGGGEPHLARRDQREALVAFLAQRYCAKNETIGFFGPVAWARLGSAEPGLVVRGGGGLRRRSLFIEAWAVDAIATAMAAEPRLAEHLLAQRNPVCDVSGGMLWQPRRPPTPLTGAAAALLAALEQPRRVAEVIDSCLPDEAAADQRAELAETLRGLRTAGAVLVGLPAPIEERPEARLRRYLAGVPDPALREELLARMDTLDRAVDRVRAAAGDPESLLAALEGLEAQFGVLTGRAGRRDKPAQRLGRALVYEDCRRDLDVTIGADLLAQLREPLSLVLDTARWFVAEAGVELERDLRARYRSLQSRATAPVALCDLVLACGDVLNGLPGTAVDRVGDDFRARWSELLDTAEGSPARMSSQTLRPLVRALFPAGAVGWRAARQHSPDLLLRMVPTAGGPRPQWVLGEVHLALNTLENRPFLTQADDRAELLAATAADFPDGRFVPVYPKDAPEVSARTYPPPAMDLPERYRYWSYTADDGHPVVDEVLPAAGLTVYEDRDRLVVAPRDGQWQAPLLEVLGEFLTAVVVNRFQIRAPAPHRPRLLLDDMVLARETWQVPVGAVPVPAPDTADYRHRRLREWLVEQGMPRFLFAKTGDQPKPYLVDRDAPLSLRNLARGVRRSRSSDPDGLLTLVEMLPAPDELWLADAEGRRYTSELRMVAFDGTQPSGPLVDIGPGAVS